MLSPEQTELARTEPKEFLQQYRFLRTQAESLLARLDFWDQQEQNTGEEFSAYKVELVQAVRRLADLEQDIFKAVDQAELKPNYKTFLILRYIEGLTVKGISERLLLNVRWCQRLQARALEAFSKAI